MDRILFSDKYRIESTRLPHWNYSDPGYYFVTICTTGKFPFFGHIKDGVMLLNDIGHIAERCWREISQHYPLIKLDEYTVMPDHIHGIIAIGSDPVETSHGKSLPKIPNGQESQNSDALRQPRIHMRAGSVGSIVNHFKGVCTATIRKTCPEFFWQPRFYDHIIRGQDSLEKIRRYIADNPAKWDRDRNRDYECCL